MHKLLEERKNKVEQVATNKTAYRESKVELLKTDIKIKKRYKEIKNILIDCGVIGEEEID